MTEHVANEIWMPYNEYLLHKEMMESMTLLAKQRMAYFFWNNFSYDGFEEHLKKQNEDKTKQEV